MLYNRKCMKPITTIVNHCVIVLLMDRITVKIKCFFFLLETPFKDSWGSLHPTLRTTALQYKRQGSLGGEFYDVIVIYFSSFLFLLLTNFDWNIAELKKKKSIFTKKVSFLFHGVSNRGSSQFTVNKVRQCMQ